MMTGCFKFVERVVAGLIPRRRHGFRAALAGVGRKIGLAKQGRRSRGIGPATRHPFQVGPMGPITEFGGLHVDPPIGLAHRAGGPRNAPLWAMLRG